MSKICSFRRAKGTGFNEDLKQSTGMSVVNKLAVNVGAM